MITQTNQLSRVFSSKIADMAPAIKNSPDISASFATKKTTQRKQKIKQAIAKIIGLTFIQIPQKIKPMVI